MAYPNIRTVSRKDLEPLVIICAASPSGGGDYGEDFLLNNYYWKSVRISDYWIPSIKYFALYVTEPESKVKYFAEVSRIVDMSDYEFRTLHGISEIKPEDKGKKAIELNNYSLVELKDPIPAIPGRGGGIQNLKYSKISKFVNAKNVQDLDWFD